MQLRHIEIFQARWNAAVQIVELLPLWISEHVVRFLDSGPASYMCVDDQPVLSFHEFDVDLPGASGSFG